MELSQFFGLGSRDGSVPTKPLRLVVAVIFLSLFLVIFAAFTSPSLLRNQNSISQPVLAKPSVIRNSRFTSTIDRIESSVAESEQLVLTDDFSEVGGLKLSSHLAANNLTSKNLTSDKFTLNNLSSNKMPDISPIVSAGLAKGAIGLTNSYHEIVEATPAGKPKAEPDILRVQSREQFREDSITEISESDTSISATGSPIANVERNPVPIRLSVRIQRLTRESSENIRLLAEELQSSRAL